MLSMYQLIVLSLYYKIFLFTIKLETTIGEEDEKEFEFILPSKHGMIAFCFQSSL